MKPLKVEFQAFGPYAGYESVDFTTLKENGLFLICGKTGTGKTMILDAITFALYGKSSGSGRDDFDSMRCTNATDDTDTFVRLTFEAGGEIYIFERRMEKKRVNFAKSVSAVRLVTKDHGSIDLNSADSLDTLIRDSIKEPLFENAKEKNLNEKAVELIGLEYSQFVQVIILPQGKFEKLLTSNSDEKEKILTSIFGEDKWQLIANKLYEEASARYDKLKSAKAKIENSLSDEGVSTITELGELINLKNEELSKLKTEFNRSEIDKELKVQQDKLEASGRFENLTRLEEQLAGLNAKKLNKEAWVKREKDALRAEKVRGAIDAISSAKAELEKRSIIVKNAKDTEEKSAQIAADAKEKYDAHILKEKEIEELKVKKAQYESKRDYYDEVDITQNTLAKLIKEETKRTNEYEKAREIYLSYAPRITELTEEVEVATKEFNEYLRLYRLGIAGVLADGLDDGMPCPVCGSTDHPSKAKKTNDTVTDKDVDDKKQLQDEKYEELKQLRDEENVRKTECDNVKNALDEIKREVQIKTERLKELNKNLVDGAKNLEELDRMLDVMLTQINKYQTDKQAYDDKLKTSQSSYSEAKVRVSAANEEAKAAEENLDLVNIKLQAELKENNFESIEEVIKLLLSDNELQSLRKQISDYEAELKTTQDSFDTLNEELKGEQRPNAGEVRRIIDSLNEKINEYTKSATLLEGEIARLSSKEKSLVAENSDVELKIAEAERDYAFAKKLRGDTGTGLQRYVLGIMFSSVIKAANRMLEMVHDGRYRLFRTDDLAQGTKKRGLELKVYDKMSEESEGRFVNTLSGGEKFLVSLALSIGMSEIAGRSGIRIEALFIDEGFGTLDEESIDDAMNILNGIKRANGLVGIISHVQLLRDTIPAKLIVEENASGSRIVKTVG